MMAPVRPHRLHRLHRPINFVLALALLLASTLGLMHGTVHAPGLQQVETAQQATAGDAASLHGWVHQLFDHHDGDQCRLYDQLSGGCAALGVPPVVLALALPAASLPCFLGRAPCAPFAHFEARGPPALR